MFGSKNITFLHQTLNDNLPDMAYDVRTHFYNLVFNRFNDIKRSHRHAKTAEPSSHHLLFSLLGKRAIAYVYYVELNNVVQIWAACTHTRFRKQRLAIENVKRIIVSEIGKKYPEYEIVFSRDEDAAIQQLRISLIHWFVAQGPAYKRLTVYCKEAKSQTYIAQDEYRNKHVWPPK